MRLLLSLSLALLTTPGLCQTKKSAPNLFPLTRFDTSEGRETPSYAEAIDFWKRLDAASPMVKMLEMGPSDAGYPLHLVLVSADGDFDIASLKRKKKSIILVNNGIHPGEPDGIDASMQLVRDRVPPHNLVPLPNVNGARWMRQDLPKNVVLAIIPVYNIGGTLNRSPYYRVDQAGPLEKGSRGSAQNLDLNRDFIKADSKEALSFARIFRMLDPDVFIDNHVTNGADFQHVMTLLSTQHNKLGGAMGEYLNTKFEPALFAAMKAKGFDMVPYVNHWSDDPPEKGWPQFIDGPRYSSGYSTLWHSFGFVPETHMLKPYPDRVAATKALMECFIDYVAKNGPELQALRAAARKPKESYPLAWKWDRSKSTGIPFKGYTTGEKPSAISGQPRRFYDRSKPYEQTIPFYNTYVDTLLVTRPKAYIIPQGWWKVIERLQANGIRMERLTRDTQLTVEAYRIESYVSAPRPYEGHHPNSKVQVSKRTARQPFRKGDWIISTDQPGARFLAEVLEPQAEDSYFAWNFFDPILGQKEGFSDYVFEETALAWLESHPELRKELEAKKAADAAFAKNGAAQLEFIYKRTPYYEPGHLQYPVYRLLR
ncbi:hypothetical protein [Flaviaesturariibacter amylovorans]|uniref:M14 family metallopeptidase n=1 Tax=Flaviaesturariibacter amylovorans TaxID=1084520 RepID=A0ABP8GGB5_9BACT